MANELKTVLLVEDDLNDIALTREALPAERLRGPVVVLRDGAEALDYLQRKGRYAGRGAEEPSLVLLDLKLPKVDGLEVLRQVNSSPALRRIPLVVLTASPEGPDLVRACDLGANAFVAKPVQFEEFGATIRHLGLFWCVLNEPPPRSLGAARG